MLDHVLNDAIGALRAALEAAMLERQVVEERFTTDALLGDTRWETSYSIPGEGMPPRVQADIALLWPTWSQAAYRTWYVNGELPSVPELDLEIVFRAQNLAASPDPSRLFAVFPAHSPKLGHRATLDRSGGPTVEASYEEDLASARYALEVGYEAALELHSDVLADGTLLDSILNRTGGWISATLVALSDAL